MLEFGVPKVEKVTLIALGTSNFRHSELILIIYNSSICNLDISTIRIENM